MRKNGSYTFYTFQHRRTHESPHLKPKPIRPVAKKDEWAFSSWDSFNPNPLVHKGQNVYKHTLPGGQEPHDVWSKTGSHGYWTLEYAKGALKELRRRNKLGEFDSRDTYGDHVRSLRYEFRIVLVTKSFSATPIPE